MAKESEKKAKARIPTAQKRDKQAAARNVRNRVFKSKVRTTIRKFEAAIGGEGNATESLKEVYSLMDKAVKKGVFPANKASRTKARMAARIAKV
jgi:small subunit ribosomal protein S20